VENRPNSAGPETKTAVQQSGFGPALRGGLALALAAATVAALLFFWRLGDQGRTAQLQLVQIEAAINFANGLEWQAISDRAVNAQEQEDLQARLQEVENLFSNLPPKVLSLREVAHLHDVSLRYAEAITIEVSFVARGKIDEAAEVDKQVVNPTLEELRTGLLTANQVQAKRAQSASRIQIFGSVAVVVFSCCFMLVLLRKAQKLLASKLAAEMASRTKSEFLANMSHEIRTPINGVLGMTDLLLGTELSGEQKEYAAMLKTSGELLLGTINDILDFSKIEAGKLDMDPVTFDLHRTVEDVVRAFTLKAYEKRVELMHEIANDVPRFMVGDPGRLRQILVNLLGNALKFTQQGEVVVRTLRKGKTGKEFEIQFDVADTGIGIPRNKHSAIFEAFAQADASTTRNYGGTGLGLAISAKLAGMMGGRIWVESSPGKGSTFSFTAQLGETSSPENQAALMPQGGLLHMPVLVVDDNATNRRILQDITQGWGMKPYEAEGGDLALEILLRAKDEGHAFPLALIDGHMPGMDGFELAKRIKEDPRLSGATIMMLTSAESQGDAARCRELGISAYLIKPIRKTELLTAILTVLGHDAESPAPAKTETVTRETLLRILIAEDNHINQALLVRMLEKMGHIPVTTENGLQAIERLAAESFDLVLMDVQMPEMDGFQATRKIREQERVTGFHVPIVALTANAMKGDEDDCLKAGMDRYLSKPISGEKLREALTWVIERQGQSWQAEVSQTVPASDRQAEALRP